ncbi:unnamed protein product [Protopolystoma xenopodis]|uniref:Uncharacterized protein n=1 Tax=Protopolystoma xenopodis TaxID=117903 RepID=A0A448X8F7_9PLAT|nr:unnamed protein product [Protopolystoma xenopodis]
MTPNSVSNTPVAPAHHHHHQQQQHLGHSSVPLPLYHRQTQGSHQQQQNQVDMAIPGCAYWSGPGESGAYGPRDTKQGQHQVRLQENGFF